MCFGGQKPIVIPDKRTKDKNMDAQNIADSADGKYFRQNKGAVEIVTFEASRAFAIEMKREAAKHYLERNVKLEGAGRNWRLTMQNELVGA